MTVQVTKKTSTAHLLLAGSEALAKLGRPINPDTCVVIEPCLRPGLERRLRQYELVWDVVSAWDHDSANTLIILPDSSDPDGELNLASVPKTLKEPAGFVLALYVLQRPGKWSQRYVTLKENGQMFASKKQDWKSSDKDVARLCHLSDFDLYLPTESEMRKQLRPPKRYCYAVRSQEKASLFADSAHYVHFFSTEDPNVARQFRSCVQGWRSWYLVNRKLGLCDLQEPLSPASRSQPDHSPRVRPSVDPSPRARPLVDIPSSTRPFPSSRESTPSEASPRSGIPPVPPFPASLQEKPPPVFASSGLLGNAYDERKHQAARKDAATRRRGTVTSDDGPFVDEPSLLSTRSATALRDTPTQRRGTVNSTSADGPFVGGPSLLNGRGATAPTSDGRPRTAGSDVSRRTRSRPDSPEPLPGWFPSALQHSAGQRTTTRTAAPLARRPSTSSHAPSRAPSIRQRVEPRHPPLPTHPLLQEQQQSQPLIDLTPTFIEPPQWSRENRGRGVRAPQGKPLVDLATGPARSRDAPPPKSLVRRPEAGGATLLQMYDQQQQQRRPRTRAGTMTEDGGGFTGGGLVAGLGRRATVKSTASGSVSGRQAAAAYVQGRGRAMGVGEGERERARERLRRES